MTITKLKETNGEQVRKLLEASGITGIKAVGKRFDMCCPACEKPEAFIDYQGETIGGLSVIEEIIADIIKDYGSL